PTRDAEPPRPPVRLPHRVPQPPPLGFRPALAQVEAVMAQVDAAEHNLLTAAPDEAFHLGDDLLGRPAAQHRPDVRDDAVGAVEQAAVLHLDEGPLMPGEAADAG